MNDERRPEGEPPEDEEDKGLGLTEEFKRLEEEIARERSGREDVRFDETDSSEWVAPVSRPGDDTEEWAAPESFGEDGEEADRAEDPAADEDAAAAKEPAAGRGEPEDSAQPAAGDAAAPPADGEAAEETDAAAEETDAAPAGTEADAVPAAGDEADAAPAAGEAAVAAPDSDAGEAAAPADPPTTARPPASVLSDAPAIEHTVVRDRPLTAAAAGGGGGYPPVTDEDIADRTPALWWRFLTGSVMIIVAVATSVALSGLLAFNSLAGELGGIGGVEREIDSVQPGEPFTILIVGSDKRSNTPGDPGRSDTTMLLRVDAQDDVLSLFSLPRDLKVDIPGYGVGKLNEAYTDGGVKLTLKTVKQLTGLKINYVVNVDFQGFADAVDAIGCVYVDVDRDYFNDNSTAVSATEQYATIDVNAGYQRLCGLNALDYVRYRHTDSDFVRAARQQDFLRNARAQVPAREVLPIIGGDTGNKLLDIFTKYTTTSIQTPAQLISVLKSFIAISDTPIREVHFNGSDSLENGIAYVTATQEQIDKAVQEFIGEEDSAGGPASAPSKPGDEKGGKGKPDKKQQDDTADADVTSTANDACSGGVDKVAAFGRTSARRLKFPVFVPTVMVPGSCYDPGSRQYDIKDTDDHKQAAYKLVLNLNSTTAAGEYYGVMGTEWGDPPILEKKSETITMGDRDYDLYYDGDRLRLVAFHVDGNSYWVSNTLLQSLSDDQMLAIAESMEEAHG